MQTQISLLLGDWWSWFWAQTGVNGPPLAQADKFSTPQDTPLTVPDGASVLANDFEPEGGPMVAALSASPQSGQVQFHPDGSFQYSPAPGYSGLVHFSYQASDFTLLSNVATVTIAVGLVGDYDHSGTVNLVDFSMWRADFASTSLLGADGNGDGIVDAADYAVWRDSLGAGIKIAGDYDFSGTVDQLDYNVWQQTFGSTTILAADGNGDGIVDAADFTVWRDHYSPPPPVGTAGASAATISPALPESAVAEIGPASPVIASPLVAAANASFPMKTRIAADFTPSLAVAQSALTSLDLLRTTRMESASECCAARHNDSHSVKAIDIAFGECEEVLDSESIEPSNGPEDILAARCATHSKRLNA